MQLLPHEKVDKRIFCDDTGKFDIQSIFNSIKFVFCILLCGFFVDFPDFISSGGIFKPDNLCDNQASWQLNEPVTS